MSAVELIAAEAFADVSPASDGAVRAELWISFVSLMRSNLAALTTTGRLAEASLLQTSPTSFTVQSLQAALTVSISLDSGDGAYRVERPREKSSVGVWHLGVDATVSIDHGAVENMELGLEALAAKLWKQEPLAPLPEGNHG